MTPAELKEKSRKAITSPFTGMEYTIKSLSQIDFSRTQLDGILPAQDNGYVDEQKFVVAFGKKSLDTMQWVLEHGMVNPAVVFGTKDVTDGQIHADWMKEDQAFLYSEILKFSGLDDDAQNKLKDFLKNGNGSSSSTPSPNGTASSPMNS